jgi:hypothetical protein
MNPEHFVWECERCGRKGIWEFGLHATSKLTMDCCDGKVRRVKWKNSTW